MNIFFVCLVPVREVVCTSVHVSSESLWVILCIFIFGLQLVLPLRTRAGICDCGHARVSLLFSQPFQDCHILGLSLS